MYSVVLMAALTTGADTPSWLFGGCHGCHGCFGGSHRWFGGCHGCYGGGWGGCHGCYGGGGYGGGCYGGGCWGSGCHGCYGGAACYGGGCYGCVGSAPAMAHPPGAPAPKPPEKVPAPKPADKTTATASQARMVVQLPADAKFYVDDQLMKATSDRREFKTPTLEQGQAYFYILRAEVIRDGKTFTQTKRVTVHAGDEVRASFSELPADLIAARTEVSAKP